MKHILFDNITIWDSNGGLSIQQRSAGTIQNVTFSNIHVETRYQAGRWWGNGEWLSVTRIPRHPDDRVGTMRDLQFINITAKSENGGLLSGFPNHGLESALFENVYVKIMTWSNYSQHPQPCCAITKPICFNSTFTRIDGHEQCLVPHHDEHTDDSEQHLQHHYKKIPCQGSRDYRPLASSVPPECPRGHDRVASKADGIFVEQVRNLRFANVTIEFETPRKPWFGRCIRFRHNENEDYYPHNNNSHHRVQCIGESEGKFGNEKILESAMTIGLQLFGRRLSWELNISSLSDWLLLGSIAMALTCIATHNTKGRHLFGRSGHVTHEAPTTTEKTRLLPRCFSPKLAQKIDHEDGRRSSFDSLSASETTTTILWQNKCLGRRRRYRISVPLFLASLCLLWLFLRPVLGESPSASNRNTNINGAKVPPPPPPKPGMSPQQDHHHYQQQQEQQQVLQVVETESWNGDRWIGAEQRWATLDGRPCVSPADLEAPPDATFDGDWKIVLSASKDPYGWTYERGENPKRQRIWLRILKPITREQAVVKKQQSRSGAAKLSPKTTMKTPAKILPSKLLPKSKSRISTKAATATKIMDTQKVKAALNNALQNIQDDWNFKGFGFSFYKSFLFKKSVGMAFRIPLTTNWDVWERHPEWPSVSMSLLFFYPFTIAASIGGSVNVEWLQWVIVQGGITLRHVIAMILLTLARGFMLAGSALAFPVTRQLYNMPTSWDLLPSLQHSLTEKPTFSSTLQQRVGVSYSWRLSAARGYETRRNIWHLYLPTLLSLIQHLDRVQQQGQRILRRNPYVDYYVRKRQHKRGDTALVASSSSSSSSTAFQPTSLLEKVRDTDWAEWWLRRKTGSLGVSTGYPIPDKPHFSCSGVLSLSGFYFRRETVSSTAGGVSKEDEVAAAVTASMLKSGKNTSQEEEDETSESEEDTAGLARNVASASSVKKTTANA